MIALYAMDFLGAIIHYYLDNYTGNHKIIKQVAHDFQLHHDNPSTIAKFTIVDALNQVSTFAFLPFTCFVVNMCLKYNDFTHYVFQLSILMQIIVWSLGIFSQVPHILTHKMNILSKKERNTFKFRLIAMLQKYHIILNPNNHNIHHKGFDKNYSVFNGWSTSLVNRMLNNRLS
jgi:hypothetical protein